MTDKLYIFFTKYANHVQIYLVPWSTKNRQQAVKQLLLHVSFGKLDISI